MSVFVQSILRHFLTIIGTWIVSTGLIDADQASEVAGAVFVIASVAWSIYDKRKNR